MESVREVVKEWLSEYGKVDKVKMPVDVVILNNLDESGTDALLESVCRSIDKIENGEGNPELEFAQDEDEARKFYNEYPQECDEALLKMQGIVQEVYTVGEAMQVAANCLIYQESIFTARALDDETDVLERKLREIYEEA